MTVGTENAKISQAIVGVVAVFVIELEWSRFSAPFGEAALLAHPLLEPLVIEALFEFGAGDRIAILDKIGSERFFVIRSLPEIVASAKHMRSIEAKPADAFVKHRVSPTGNLPLTLVNHLTNRSGAFNKFNELFICEAVD